MRKPIPALLKNLTIVVFSLVLTGQAAAFSQVFETRSGPVTVTRMADGIDTPWAMAMLPDGRLLVTERDGTLLLVSPGSPTPHQTISGLPPIAAFGQGGLLDVVLDPDHEENAVIYLSFSDEGENGSAGTAIARARLDLENLALRDVRILYSMSMKDRSGRHFGSRIVPDGKGNLWFTIGDRGTQPRAQDPFDPAGNVMRITTQGTIPADNPFADGKDALPHIWSTGHRNPQGATRHPETGKLWTQSHGARGGDEINIPEAGKNYGWPVVSYGVNYSGTKIGVGQDAPGFEQPIFYWDPSIAPSGMAFYTGNSIPQWKGNLFIGALKFQYVSRLEVEGERIVNEEKLFEGEFGRIRDVRSFPDGALWFLTDDSDGAIYRVSGEE